MTYKELLLEPVLKRWYEYKAEHKEIFFDKIQNEQINELLNIFYRNGEVIADTIRKEFNLATTLLKINVEQLRYKDLELKDMIDYHAQTGNDYSWLVPKKLLSILLSCGLGFTQENFIGREITELERRMLNTIMQIITQSSFVFWMGALEMPRFELSMALKDNPKIHKEEQVIQASVFIEVGEYGIFQLVFMATTTNVRKFMERHEIMSKEKRKRTVNLEGRAVADLFVPFEVILGTTAVTMNDILSLQRGDIFQLDQKIGGPISIQIGENAKFVSLLGKKGRELVVRIENLKNPGKDAVLAKKDSSATAHKESTVQPAAEINEEAAERIPTNFQKVDAPNDDILQEIEAKAGNEKAEEDDFNWDINDL